MTRRSLVLLLALGLLVGGLSTATASTAPLHRAIVQYAGALPDGIGARLGALGAAQVVPFPAFDAVAVTAPLALLQRLAADPAVVEVQPERRLVWHTYASVGQIDAQGVEQPQAYQVAPGDVRTRPGVTGAGQTIAIIDTGIFEQHPDLDGRIAASLNFEGSYALPAALSTAQRDEHYARAGAAATLDDWGHGTHVAGIAAGSGAMASGREQHGVAQGANLANLKLADIQNGLPADFGWERNAMAALDWLARHHRDARFGQQGIRVANNSWGLTPADDPTNTVLGDPGRDPMKAAVEKLVSQGIVMVFSAGNDGPGPVAAVPNGMDAVISVAASCKAVHSCAPGTVAGFSSRGPQVDVAAPGDGVLSTILPASLVGALGQTSGNFGATPEQQARNRAFYGTASGTSMAAPHVAGLVALLLQANPALTPAQVRQILVDTADDMAPAGPDERSGAGQVDARRALIAAHTLIPPPPPPPVPGPNEVFARGFAFDPFTRAVPVDTTVTWTNFDAASHTATSGAPGSPDGRFDLPLPSSGGSGSFTFTTPGTYRYYCKPHPFMEAEIVVTPG